MNTCKLYSNVPISHRYNNVNRELPIPSCHCIGEPFANSQILDHMEKAIKLELLDIYGRPTRKFSESGGYVPKTLHDFQYSGISKNPSYYLDMSESIGNRPVIRSHDLDNPPEYHGLNKKTHFDYSCNQPIWKSSCI